MEHVSDTRMELAVNLLRDGDVQEATTNLYEVIESIAGGVSAEHEENFHESSELEEMVQKTVSHYLENELDVQELVGDVDWDHIDDVVTPGDFDELLESRLDQALEELELEDIIGSNNAEHILYIGQLQRLGFWGRLRWLFTGRVEKLERRRKKARKNALAFA